MNWKNSLVILGVSASVFVYSQPFTYANETESNHTVFHAERLMFENVKSLPENMKRFTFNSGRNFEYPDAVRGIYVTGHSAGGERFQSLVNLINKTDLNAMVIDIKDDHGNLTYIPDENSPYNQIGQPYIKDTTALLDTLEKEAIYPIARVVVFKDSVLAKSNPEWSFKDGNEVWANGRGESFVNPFVKEVWEYNVGIAIEAAKMGFKEIQFDYVRFPEGFERRDEELIYNQGDYKESKEDNIQKRVSAVTDFVAYAKEQLEPYDVDVSVDIFGYTATLPEAPGIGQNFSKISENVDVISSMIYPSHWTSYFGIAKPDLEPYRLVEEYAKVEKVKLSELETPPTSRPWIQDFTASWLGSGNYKVYGPAEVEAQIRALNDQGIDEYLIWNAGNSYTTGVDYTP
ncbi:GTP-binding protein [Bacillus coahuilensis p1.1.43]|uniref:GTP-binding protein n=1 Tax=Bacillus coahuilensis p1.1.43 TaxID=1150625 RepID=A0A147KA05_9BACI|nr:putative glycoside hydrolase [Bacillus coahuilensis]KUP07524.1 GTP-binding protein [Bacillus coahuilensis p1.1.43]